MKNANNVQANFRITSYEDGRPVTTEYEINTNVHDEEVPELIERLSTIGNVREKAEDDTEGYYDDHDMESDDYEDPYDYLDQIIDLERSNYNHAKAIEDLSDNDMVQDEDIERIYDDLHSMKRAGAVIFAAQVLLSIGFFCLHGKLVHGNKTVK